jgi:hypothetical protein
VKCTENGVCNQGFAPIFPLTMAGKIFSLPRDPAGKWQGKRQTDMPHDAMIDII